MVNEMILQKEMLSDEELNKVNGATCDQLHELTQAMMSNNRGLSVLASFAELATKIKVGSLGNIPLAHAMEYALKTDLGVNSNISVGWGGTGFRESGNSYSDKITGHALNHADVVKRLEAYSKRVL